MIRLFLLSVCALFIGKAAAKDSLKFHFRDERSKTFVVENWTNSVSAKNAKRDWIRLRSEEHPDQVFESSARIALQLKPGSDPAAVLSKIDLQVIQTVNDFTFILSAADAETAAQLAQQYSKLPEVLNCVPVMRSSSVGLQTPVAAVPNDTLFSSLWHLQNAFYPGVDLNIRGAWPVTRGESVVIGMADQAIDIAHPDLSPRAMGGFHFNFVTGTTNLALTAADTHGTSVAGLAVAEMNNSRGVVGAAPQSRFGSWRIFTPNGAITDDQQLMNMFQYRSNSVAVQNHSWASTSRSLYSIGFLSKIGIDAAIQNGRDGKGVIMVRSAGNRRLGGFEGNIYLDLAGNANDDGFCTDPNVIVVGAARANGRVARYSSPGANILVAGLSNESNGDDTTSIDGQYPALTTTAPDGAYTNFTGTSGAVPQIAGIASLILSANPSLTYRDVQQILLLSSRHFDSPDPSLRTNGVGLKVSHNLGFGIPDARTAVLLAKAWINRPARQKLTFVSEEQKTIPDQGFLVRTTGANVPGELFSIPARMPKEGAHPDFAPGEMFRPDAPIDELRVVYVGQATNTINTDLRGKVALIQRGGASFFEKVKRAEQAGARSAIVFDNVSSSNLLLMNMTNFVSIPSTFIGKTAGDALVEQSLNNPEARVQLRLNPATYTFNVTDPLSLEHVGLKIRTDNLRRSDIRITLTSPQGTRSILQRANNDPSTNAPIDWTYISTQHFYESSVGTWTVQISDELAGAESFAYYMELQLYGVPIADTDADGLDDNWETASFGNLNPRAHEDADQDGFSNVKELLLATHPIQHNGPQITQQPIHRTSTIGKTVSFDVQAIGMQPLFYQWKFKGTNLLGATQSSLTLTNLKASQAGTYAVEVSNLSGSILSTNAQLGFFTCAFTTAASQTNYTFERGSGFISVTASNGCSWGAASSQSWLTFTSTTNGSGDGSVSFSVGTNLGLPRTATITIAGRTHSVSQAGAFLPQSLGNRSILFYPDPGSAITNQLLLVVAPNGTAAQLFAVTGLELLQAVDCTFVLNPSGTATLSFNGTQITFDFASGTAGTFEAIDLLGESFPGTFALLESGPDFNADGRTDLLFHGSNRVLYTWMLNRNAFLRNAAVRQALPSNIGWRVAGATDLNGDGFTDVLFQSGTRHAAWFMNKTSYMTSQFLNTPVISSAWHSVALGDFNDDGKAEILLQNNVNGRLTAWFLTGNSVTKSAGFSRSPTLGWRVFAAGDFNGDRKTDILMQHTSNRTLIVWYYDGFTFAGSGPLRGGLAPAPGWRATGIGDFNADGKNDVIFQTADGLMFVWYMDGRNWIGAAPIRKGIAPTATGKFVAPN